MRWCLFFGETCISKRDAQIVFIVFLGSIAHKKKGTQNYWGLLICYFYCTDDVLSVYSDSNLTIDHQQQQHQHQQQQQTSTILNDSSVHNQERTLNHMILQLQMVRERLRTDNRVSAINFFCNNNRFEWRTEILSAVVQRSRVVGLY